MAFSKTALAVVSQPSIYKEQWQEVRTKAARVSGDVAASKFNKTASINLSEYSPDRYLLTHCTIVASVETEDAPNVKLGELEEGGKKINRKWSNYFIKPDSNKYVNANKDCWSRKTLLNTYRTFIGAENYVEHVQIPELSKGKVIDAVARDLGDTVYIDILVATDRNHTTLIQDIESGKMSALSMGCTIQYSQCSKCGNVAADDTELCPCIKYSKGDTFIDQSGVKRMIAEICGHDSDLDSVVFIEASWVANPAFKGAVLRNILNPSDTVKSASPYAGLFGESPLLDQFLASSSLEDFMAKAAMERPQQAFEAVRNVMVKSASSKKAFGFEDEEETKKEKDDFVEEIQKDLQEKVEKKVKEKILKEVSEKYDLDDPEPDFKGSPEREDLNDSVVNSSQNWETLEAMVEENLTAYLKFRDKYASEFQNEQQCQEVFQAVFFAKKNGWNSLRTQNRHSTKSVIAALYLRDRDFKPQSTLTPSLVKCLDKVGSTKGYNSVEVYLKTCELAMGRKLANQEKRVLIEMGKLLP